MSEVSIREKLGVTTPAGKPRYLKKLVYGDPGCGKTYLLGTANDCEETFPYLHIDIEGGTETLLTNWPDTDVVEVRSLKRLTEIQNMLYKEKDDLPYRCIGIDNFSELQAIDIHEIMLWAKETARDPSKVDVDVPAQREWGKTREHMRAIVRSFRDLPCHLIITAHVAEVKEDGEPTRYYPGFGGRAKTEIAGFMDIVGYMYVDQRREGTDRIVQTVASRRVLAKDRTQTLPDTIHNPTMEMLVQALRKGQDEGEEPSA
jgi:hypothetical protein